MKYVKLFEGFLSEKESGEELDSFGNKKKKKKEVEDPGTVLSNTTGIIATAEVSEAKKNEDISKWDDKRVEKIYGYYLDGLSNAEREKEEKKKLSASQKREVLKKQQVKFEKQFESIVLQELNEKWKKKLHAVYSNKEEFLDFDETYGIAKRLGYEDPEKLWAENPTIEGSTDPNDLKIVK